MRVDRGKNSRERADGLVLIVYGEQTGFVTVSMINDSASTVCSAK